FNFRTRGVGGGILLYIRTDLFISELCVGGVKVELVAAKLRLGGRLCIVLAAYRSNYVNYKFILEHINDLVVKHKDMDIIIMGDFNVDYGDLQCNVDWWQDMAGFGFEQMISEGTRITNTTKTIIDHCYIKGRLKVMES